MDPKKPRTPTTKRVEVKKEVKKEVKVDVGKKETTKVDAGKKIQEQVKEVKHEVKQPQPQRQQQPKKEEEKKVEKKTEKKTPEKKTPEKKTPEKTEEKKEKEKEKEKKKKKKEEEEEEHHHQYHLHHEHHDPPITEKCLSHSAPSERKTPSPRSSAQPLFLSRSPSCVGRSQVFLRSPRMREFSTVGKKMEEPIPGLPIQSASPTIQRYASSIHISPMVMIDEKTKRMMRKMLRSFEAMEERLMSDGYGSIPGLRESVQSELLEFAKSYFHYLNHLTDKTLWNSHKKIQPSMSLSLLPKCEDIKERKELLARTCILKLNGGAGRYMGCTGPKSAIEMHGSATFLDLAVAQAEHLVREYGSDVDFSLMNSFVTHDDTLKIVSATTADERVHISVFTQSRFPFIRKDTHAMIPEKFTDPKAMWYPPGDGDVFQSLINSRILREWVNRGKDTVFIGNIDNVGATFDFEIAKFMQEQSLDFITEVVEYTPNDSERSFLVDYMGKVKVVRMEDLPPSERDNFLKQQHYVRTNNCWVNLHALQRCVEEGNIEAMALNVTIDNFVPGGGSAIKLSRFVASAISLFERSAVICVPRSRYIPVRGTNDLLLVQSNLFDVDYVSGQVGLNPGRMYDTLPMVRLGDNFRTVQQYLSRFENIPDILELDRLTLSGNIRFGKNVVLKGTVLIIAPPGGRIDIPSGTILENKIVNGSILLLDH